MLPPVPFDNNSHNKSDRDDLEEMLEYLETSRLVSPTYTTLVPHSAAAIPTTTPSYKYENIVHPDINPTMFALEELLKEDRASGDGWEEDSFSLPSESTSISWRAITPELTSDSDSASSNILESPPPRKISMYLEMTPPLTTLPRGGPDSPFRFLEEFALSPSPSPSRIPTCLPAENTPSPDSSSLAGSSYGQPSSGCSSGDGSASDASSSSEDEDDYCSSSEDEHEHPPASPESTSTATTNKKSLAGSSSSPPTHVSCKVKGCGCEVPFVGLDLEHHFQTHAPKPPPQKGCTRNNRKDKGKGKAKEKDEKVLCPWPGCNDYILPGTFRRHVYTHIPLDLPCPHCKSTLGRPDAWRRHITEIHKHHHTKCRICSVWGAALDKIHPHKLRELKPVPQQLMELGQSATKGVAYKEQGRKRKRATEEETNEEKPKKKRR